MEPRRREAPRRRAGARRAGRLARGVADRRRRARCVAGTTGSTCRATTRATCSGTRSSPLGNTGGPEHLELLDGFADDELLAPYAEWARARIEERGVMLTDVAHLRQTERWIANVRVGAVAFAVAPGGAQHRLSAGLRDGRRGSIDGRVRDRRGDPLLRSAGSDLPRQRQVLLAVVALGFDTAVIVRVPARSTTSRAGRPCAR